MGLDIVVESNVSNLSFSFRAGSYSGFHQFRCWLADMVSQELTRRGVPPAVRNDMPFVELLFHSDCDGVLKSGECKALLKDFVAFDGAARAYCVTAVDEDVAASIVELDPSARPRDRVITERPLSVEDREWWLVKWGEWRLAVEVVAVGGGVVVFC